MQISHLRNNNSDKLIFFALGWGSDPSVIKHLISDIALDYDVVCSWDYKTIEQVSLNQNYKHIYLVAWSFGVWAAEKMFAQETTFSCALAFAGSPHPVNDIFGIEPKRLKISILGFKKHGVATFDSLVYEGAAVPQRQSEERIKELEILLVEGAKQYSPHIEWTKAYVCERDTIFPRENLLRFWAIDTKVLPLPHFPLADYKLIKQELGI